MMKLLKITVLILLLLNIAVPVFQSCTKDASKVENLVSLEKLVNDYNQGVMFAHEKAIFMEGDMTIITLPSLEVIFFLNKGDKSKNEVFLGQGKELSSLIQKSLGKVKVAYLREAIAMESADGSIYTFSIGERKGHGFIQKLASSWSGKGYGLAYNHERPVTPDAYKGLSSLRDLATPRGTPTPSECSCVDAQPGSGGDCDSGGVGAISCSVGATVIGTTTVDAGCMVTCGQGYYACCKNYDNGE